MIRKQVILDKQTENFLRETAFRNRTTQSEVVRTSLKLLHRFMDEYDLDLLIDLPTYIRSSKGKK